MTAKKGGRKSTAKKSSSKKNGSNGGGDLSHPDGITDAVEAGRAAGGSGTASGQEAAWRSGDQEVPKGDDRGSTVDPGEVGEPDYVTPPGKNIGGQTEAAIFLPNGQMPNRMVGSPSGPVPVASVANSPEEADKLIEQHRETISEQFKGLKKGKRLTEDQIANMKGADLRAVAHDRGYDISHNAGTRGTRAGFLTAQNEDKNLEDAE